MLYNTYKFYTSEETESFNEHYLKFISKEKNTLVFFKKGKVLAIPTCDLTLEQIDKILPEDFKIDKHTKISSYIKSTNQKDDFIDKICDFLNIDDLEDYNIPNHNFIIQGKGSLILDLFYFITLNFTSFQYFSSSFENSSFKGFSPVSLTDPIYSLFNDQNLLDFATSNQNLNENLKKFFIKQVDSPEKFFFLTFDFNHDKILEFYSLLPSKIQTKIHKNMNEYLSNLFDELNVSKNNSTFIYKNLNKLLNNINCLFKNELHNTFESHMSQENSSLQINNFCDNIKTSFSIENAFKIMPPNIVDQIFSSENQLDYKEELTKSLNISLINFINKNKNLYNLPLNLISWKKIINHTITNVIKNQYNLKNDDFSIDCSNNLNITLSGSYDIVYNIDLIKSFNLTIQLVEDFSQNISNDPNLAKLFLYFLEDNKNLDLYSQLDKYTREYFLSKKINNDKKNIIKNKI